MKQSRWAVAAVLGWVLVGEALAASGQELAPGLVGEYFAGVGGFPAAPLTKKPTLVRVDRQVNFEQSEGDFAESRIDDNFFVRWTGVIAVEKAGEYTFFTASDDGSRLFIGDKLVVDNGGVHSMMEKSGKVTLAVGKHAVRVEFFESGGEAGCRLMWQPPGGEKQAVPEKALFHAKDVEKIEWDKGAWEKRPRNAGQRASGKFAATDYGSYYTGTVKAGKGNTTAKGLVIKVGTKEKPANVLFDTELMRYSAGWTGGWLMLARGRDGLEGQPAVEGDERFATKQNTPGWARDGEFKDPRKTPLGPLPREWAKYKGLYLHGEKVVLSYSVGGVDVLELPGFESAGGVDVFSRTIAIGPTTATSTVLLLEREAEKEAAPVTDGIVAWEKDGVVSAAGLVGGPARAEWQVIGGRLQLELPPLASRACFQVRVWSGPRADLPKFIASVKGASTPRDPAEFIKGGPARWTQAVTTKGSLGTEKGAYVMDTISVPYDNPYHSYMRLGGVDFFDDGRAAVCTIDGDVWVVSHLDASLQNVTWKRYATGLFQATGLKVVDGKVYVLGRDQITRLHDLNDDGEADFYESFNNDCHVQVAYHEFALDLHTDPQGNFYYMKGSDLGGNRSIHNGTMLKVSRDGSKLEVVAVGFRAPNGMGVGPNGELTAGDNQGEWTPSCPINWIEPGRFYGHVHKHYPQAQKDSPRAPAMVWLPMSFDNSNGSQVWVTSDKWGPYFGRMLHLSYGKCSLMAVMMQDVGGVKQGGVVRFPFKFVSGGMRGRFNPADGQLYIVGMRGWQTDGSRDGCFHRVRYTGKPANMPLDLTVSRTGVEITFTDPLDREAAADVDAYGVEWFNIKRTSGYGSPEFKVSKPEEKGREAVEIKSVKVSEDGRRVTLELGEVRPVTNMIIKYKIRGADGTAISQEIANTINAVP